jgi:hypothetical protein
MFKQEVPNKQCNNGLSQRILVVMAMKRWLKCEVWAKIWRRNKNILSRDRGNPQLLSAIIFLRPTQRNSGHWLFIAVWRWQLQIMTSCLFLVWGRPLFWKADPKLEICEMYLSSVSYFRQEPDRRPWLCKSRFKYIPPDVVGVVVSSNSSKRRFVTRTHCQTTHPIGDTLIPCGKFKGWIMDLFPDQRTLVSWRVNLATKGPSGTELRCP